MMTSLLGLHSGTPVQKPNHQFYSINYFFSSYSKPRTTWWSNQFLLVAGASKCLPCSVTSSQASCISLPKLGCPEPCSVDKASFKLRYLLVSTLPMLRLKVYTTTPRAKIALNAVSQVGNLYGWDLAWRFLLHLFHFVICFHAWTKNLASFHFLVLFLLKIFILYVICPAQLVPFQYKSWFKMSLKKGQERE